MKTDTPLQLNLRQILHDRLPASGRRWVPRVLVGCLERIIRQRQLNAILRHAHPHRGSRFTSKVLEYLQIDVQVQGLENIPPHGRFIFASNHPLGGLDGIALIDVLGGIYGDDSLRFPVNDLLMNVKPLDEVFIPVNKFGRQGREAAKGLQKAFESDKQIAIFPAGLVSRLHKGGGIKDLQWQKSFVAKALDSGRQIIPVYFQGLNSRKFYRVARWRKRLGLKFNIEQILLPSELCKAAGSRFTISIGTPVDPAAMQAGGLNAAEIAQAVREACYRMAEP